MGNTPYILLRGVINLYNYNIVIVLWVVWIEPNNKRMTEPELIRVTESGGVLGEESHSSYGTGQHFLSVSPTPQKQFIYFT